MNNEERLYRAGYAAQFRGPDFLVTLWLSPEKEQVTTQEALLQLDAADASNDEQS